MCLLHVIETLLTQLYSPEAVEQYHSVSHLLSLGPRGTHCFISSRFIENKTKRMGNSSAVQSTSCSWRRPNFTSQHPLVMPHSAWNSSSTGTQHPLLTSESIAFRCNAHTHTHTHVKNNFKNKNTKFTKIQRVSQKHPLLLEARHKGSFDSRARTSASVSHNPCRAGSLP